MKPERWQQVNDLFESAVERAPEERAAFLEEACHGDERLRRAVERLIAGDQRAKNFIEAPAFEVAPDLLTNEPVGAMVGDQDLDLAADQRFGTYEIERRVDGSLYELGRGAMGVTYRAIDRVLDRPVALKIISTELRSRSAEARERFTREARAAAALRHPNVATVYQFGVREDTGQFFYAMELVEGETLQERVDRAGPLDVGTAIEITQQVTAALAAAEKRGLIHRDLKPANLMLVSADDEATDANRKRTEQHAVPTVKIIDFGLAKVLNAQSDAMSLTQDHFVGTPAFASPEQFAKAPVDVRSDIYSLGVTLWFLLTGYKLFSGRTIEEIRKARGSMRLPIEELKAAHVPARLRSLLRSMLAVEPADRPGTQELAARLRRCSSPASGLLRSLVALTGRRTAGDVKKEIQLEKSGAPEKLSQRQITSKPTISPEKVSEVPEKSIAVLPFENLSAESANTFFADAIHDEILTDLSNIADLKVISRTSVMQYKTGVKRNLREIADELRVAHIVEGSVQPAGNRVRVRAQLIDARTDRHLWGERYDRPLDDVFAIQTEIAKAIADHLQAKLSPTEKAALEQPPTTDLVAYDRYLRARKLLMRQTFDPTTSENNVRIIRLLEQAVARDPMFLLAQCELARAHGYLYFVGFDHSPARLALAKEALNKALHLRPDRGEPHLAAAWVAYNCHRDYETALSELAIAQRRLPNDPSVFELPGYIARRQGDWKRCISNMERACEVDPRNLWLLQQTAQTYWLLRHFPDMTRLLNRTLAVSPGDAATRLTLALIDLESCAEAQPAYNTARDVVNEDPAAVDAISELWFYLALCRRDADEISQAVASLSPEGIIPFNVRMPRSFCEGLAARAGGDAAGVEKAFNATRAELENHLGEEPDYAEALSILGMSDAALGRKEDALREGRRAAELLPVTRDAMTGAEILRNLAITYAWVGEKDLAIKQLEKLLPLYGPISYGQLRLHPWWDPLRDDPRFEKIVEESKQPVALK